MGTLLQSVVYHVSREQWEIRDYVTGWPSWVLVCVDLALWWMPGVYLRAAWKVLGQGIGLGWVLGSWDFLVAREKRWT
jgi:hypothetical protein